jgi:hypothetical protein
LGGAYARESALTHVFDVGGIVDVDHERTETSWHTDWMRQSGPRGRYNVAAAFTNVEYGEAAAGAGSYFNSYRYDSLQLAYVLTTSERTNWQFSLADGRIERSGASSVDNYSAHATWRNRVSETLETSLGVGYFALSGNLAPGTDQSGAAIDFSVSKTWAFWRLSVSGGRDVRPDGRGLLVREDTLTMRLGRPITAHIAFAVSATDGRQQTDLQTNFGSFALYGTDYSRAGVDVEWRVKQQWWLKAELYERTQSASWFGRADGAVAAVSATFRGR